MTTETEKLQAGASVILLELGNRAPVLNGVADPSQGAGVEAPIGARYNRRASTSPTAAIISTWQKKGAANTAWELDAAGGGGGGGGTAADTTFDDTGQPIVAPNVQVALVETLKRTGIYGTWDMTMSLVDATPAIGGHLEAAVVEVDSDNFNVTTINGTSTVKFVQSRGYLPNDASAYGYSRFERISAGGDVGAVLFGYVNQEAILEDVVQALGGGPTGTCTAFSLFVHDLIGFLGPAGNFTQFFAFAGGGANPPLALGSLPASTDIYLSAYTAGGNLTTNLEDNPGVSSIGTAPQPVPTLNTSGWKMVYGLYCLNASPSVPQAPISIDFGDSTNSKNPVQVNAPALPVDAADGLKYYVTAAGWYEGKYAAKGSVVEFYNNLSQIVVISAETLTQAQVQAIAAAEVAAGLAAADLDKGLPVLSWTNASLSTENTAPSYHWSYNASVDAPWPINNYQLSALNSAVLTAMSGGNHPTWRYNAQTASAQYCTVKYVAGTSAAIIFGNGLAEIADYLVPTGSGNTSLYEAVYCNINETGVVVQHIRDKAIVSSDTVALTIANDDLVSIGLARSSGQFSVVIKHLATTNTVAIGMRPPEDGIRPVVALSKASGTLTEQMFYRLGLDAGGGLGSPLTHFTQQASTIPISLADPGTRYRVEASGPIYWEGHVMQRGDVVEIVKYVDPGALPWVHGSYLMTVQRTTPIRAVAEKVFDERSAQLLKDIGVELDTLAAINQVAYSPSDTAANHGKGYVYLLAGGTPTGAFNGFTEGALAVSDGTQWVEVPASHVRGRLFTLVDLDLGTASNYYQPRLKFVGAASGNQTYVFDSSFVVGSATESSLKTLGWQMQVMTDTGGVSSIDVNAMGGGIYSLKVGRASVHRVTIDANTQINFDLEEVLDGGVVNALVCVKNVSGTSEIITTAGTMKLQVGTDVWIHVIGRNNGVGGDPFVHAVFLRPSGALATPTATEAGSATVSSTTSLMVLTVTGSLTDYTLNLAQDAYPDSRFVLIVTGGGSISNFVLNGQWSLHPAAPAWPTAANSGDVFEFARIDSTQWIRIR